MCAILGQINWLEPIDHSEFERMLDTLKSRGPDDFGTQFLSENRVALGHRRLSIIDLSAAGRQPMSNEDGTVWLVFNGEIYNYRELRRQLEALGHRFSSQTDSEVIVHGYEQWGDDCVLKFRGIFAFGIWDDRLRRLLLARDHLGTKPLYYWQADGRFVFASQPRAIIAQAGFAKQLDVEALSLYLAYGYVPGSRAIFSGMRKLRAGSRLVWEDGRLSEDRYWRLQYRPDVRSWEEAVELVRDKLAEAVRLQLVADVPIGVFLSGGIDSSAVSGLAASLYHEQLPSFTIGFDVSYNDERPFAQLAADRFGTRHHDEVFSFKDAMKLTGQYVDIYDEPLYDSSGLPTMAVSKLAHKHDTKVILAGDGGDEIFAGHRWYDHYSLDQTAAAQGLKGLMKRLLPGSSIAPADYKSDPVAAHFPLVGFLDAQTQRSLFTKQAGEAVQDHLGPLRDAFREHCPPVTTAQLMDIETYLVDDGLTKVDRASMAYGVESRVPLLDYELVEAAFRIDHELLFGGERKRLFKQAVSKWVPAEILTARKKGFSIPLAVWMQHGLADEARRLLSRGSLMSRGILDAGGVASLLAPSPPAATWLLLAAELWARRWLDGEPVANLLDTPST